MNTSSSRGKRFLDWFVREWIPVHGRTFGDTNDDWINDEDRMARCWDAAEHGADGSTHQEVIDDWRENFRTFIARHRHDYPRFESAVESAIADVERWHERNGSLEQEVG